ncbi:ATP-binding protein [Streptomyces sp. SP17BM10]|uniref:ATP-binding protein n=1 Tax=Streptomyces sp. SP17BM10 TaxID=3002530 RepID=UPI002E7722D7|nr:ATP-binding protein [Streptomyces sp. SP17BM10]MEE1786876.1 ATP-binding protein [Streptomyces sp. SP17BM10]
MTGTITAPEEQEPASGTSIDLPYRPESASQARKLVRTMLTEWSLDDLVDDAVLAASEMVTNAAKTGCHTAMTLQIIRTTAASVRILVTDGCRVLPVRIKAGSGDESGRGLELVHKLTHGCWGASLEPLGKIVHADLRVGGKP